MAQALYIQQELQEIAPSLMGLNSNVFTTPKDYFIELENVFLQRIIQSSNTKIESNYTVPQGYFEGLSNQILQKIKQQNVEVVNEELKEIAPTLSTMAKQNVYVVPKDYFKSLNISAPKAKIISFKRIVQYASAAVVIGILSVVGIKLISSNKIKQEYAAAKQTNIEKSVEQISIEELQKGVNNTIAFNNNTIEPSTPILHKLVDVEESLDFVSDEELEIYLKQNIEAQETVEGTL